MEQTMFGTRLYATRLLRSAAIALLLPLFAAPAAGSDVLKIVVDGIISPVTDEFIGRALDEAKARNDKALLIELRTPGGLIDATREIVNKILASPVPVIVYVAPSGSSAASAGFFILQAADIAAMAPATNTGAAHPVMIGAGGGDEKVDDVMKGKIESDAAAMMRSIAAKRGRNVAEAESAVRQSISFTEQEALEKKLIEIVAADEKALLAAIDGRPIRRFDGTEVVLDLAGSVVRTKEMTLKQRILSFIMDPNVAFILFSLGMLALWAEFNNPGAILPGVVGLIAILLAFFALNILPTRFAALALILVAFILFILEAKYAGNGILAAGGVVAMFLGGLLLVDSPVPEMRVSWITALAVALPFGIITVFLVSLVVRARANQVQTGEQGMVGEIGVARTDLSPHGKIFVHGELWDAVATENVEQGARVQVRRIDGLTAEVEPVR
ncbi:MAG TPA: nodulation protein NfeD [Thermoanaerobaculia bacterium]|nr:nodulation protein NfeD [Thermoanaerobaculia bacterium]